jgi:hypothetical protein
MERRAAGAVGAALLVVAVITSFVHLRASGGVVFQPASILASLAFTLAVILMVSARASEEPPGRWQRAVVAGALGHAVVGVLFLASLTVLPAGTRVSGFTGFLVSIPGWVAAVVTWPYVLVAVAGCALRVLPCP